MSTALRPSAGPGAPSRDDVVGQLHATRARLAAALATRALLLAAAVALVLLVTLAGVDLLVDVPLVVRAVARGVAVAAGLVAAAVAVYRDSLWPSLPATALWLEARDPSLQYALVTAAEQPAALPRLAPRISPARWATLVRQAALRAALPPALLSLAALLAFALLPAGTRARVLRPHAGDAIDRTGVSAPVADPLATIAVTVTPPAYAGRAAVTVDDPSTVEGLVGSVVLVRGRGAARGIAGAVGVPPGATPAAAPRRVAAAAEDAGAEARWRLAIPMPAAPAVLRLTSGTRERLVILAAVQDSAPVVTIERPARDSVLRAPTGRIALAATASDDIGLASAGFEYIVSSGSGESFTFRSGTVGARTVRGSSLRLEAELVLDSLALKPGDVVHLSAVARDRNSVSGPSLGRSETRALRVARAGEYDSVAVEAAPPAEADKSVLSQRMLLQLTEELQRRRPRLSRADVVDQSQRIAADQRRLRKRVGDLVFARAGEGGGAEESNEAEPGKADSTLTRAQRVLAEAEAQAERGAGGGVLDFEEAESPVVGINRPLLEAYNHMWDAARELEIGEPGRAIPPMRLALAAIERARQAERLYLRGRPLDVVVDVARARGQGKRPDAPPADRAPRAAVDPAIHARLVRVDAAIALLARVPSAAVDSLLLVRVGAIGEAPALAAALGEAVDALRGGRDATAALARARRLAAGEPIVRAGVAGWSAAP